MTVQQAFPIPSGGFRTNHGYVHNDTVPGMSMRQYYAGCALKTFDMAGHAGSQDRPAHIAKYCFDMAEAMLKEEESRER